jgi:RHS repeat-associated protein
MFAQLPDYDPETDQYNTANRHYTPMGRWLGPDPAGLKAVRLDDPQTWNMYAYARNNPTTLTDPSGLTPPPPESSSSCVTDYGPGPCGQPPTQATQTGANTEAQEQPQASEKPQNQQNTPPPDSRTDIVLFPRELPIAPLKGTYGWFWEMDWEAGTCSAGACRKNQNLTITLQESTNGGPFKLTGDPGKGGEVQDQISPEPKTFNQRWFVSDPGGKPRQVQIVWGKSSQDTLLKTWELHVVIKNFGDRPVYSPVQ